MNLTELLVTGYDGKEAVFALNLRPEGAAVVLTSTDEKGETVVESAWEQATEAFEELRGLLERLAAAPVPVP